MKKPSSAFFKQRNKRLLELIRDSWGKLLIAMVCMTVVSATTALNAYLIKPVLDDIFFNKNYQMLKLIPIAVLVIYFVRSSAMFIQQYLMNFVGQNIIRRLRDILYAHIQDLPLSYFHKEKTGVLMSRITYDVNIVKEMVTTAVTGAVRDVFTIVGLVFVIFYQIWELALYAAIILPVAFLPAVKLGKRVRRVSTGRQEAMAELNSFLHETFAGSKIVKAFSRENFEKKRFYGRSLQLFKLEMKETITKALASPINEMLAGLGIAFIIFYGGYHVIKGTYTTGTFVSFLAAVLMLYEPVKKLSKLNLAVQQGLAASDRIFEVLETQSDIREVPNPIILPTQSHRVTFDNVYFKYDAEFVLKGISLDVQAGEVIAMVGMSGGGKTTLVNLIPRFYEVSRGAILIDGVDIRQTSIDSLRQQISIVTQDPILFNDTVGNNIAYGNPRASEAEIKNAAKAAFAYDFIRQFNNGFDTMIGELGGRLSGGQKQRICIARALLKDAPILILDEATSSLDSESETLVQKALENLMVGRTTFVIAHRLSTIGYASRIIVIVDGQIVEEGTHEELISNDGEYCKLYQLQFSNQALTDSPS